MYRLPQPGAILAGKYAIDALLGEGGMGAVYSATNQTTGRRFAIKLLLPTLVSNPEARARFLREAKAAGRISHPNVVEVFDVVNHDDGSLCIVMELLQGRSLEQLAGQGRPLPVEQALSLLIPAFVGVAAAHRAGVVHRDLKPANIFLSDPVQPGGAPVPKVVDFGVSKVVAGDHRSTGLTATGSSLGTYLYMSPEQLRGHEVDARADVYAAGVIVYELVSGSMPFVADNPLDLALKVMEGRFESLESMGLPARLQQIVARAMAVHAASRYSSMDELVRELQSLLGDSAGALASSGGLPASAGAGGPGSYPAAGVEAPGARVPVGIPTPRAVRTPSLSPAQDASTLKPIPAAISTTSGLSDLGQPPPTSSPWLMWGGAAVIVAVGATLGSVLLGGGDPDTSADRAALARPTVQVAEPTGGAELRLDQAQTQEPATEPQAGTPPALDSTALDPGLSPGSKPNPPALEADRPTEPPTERSDPRSRPARRSKRSASDSWLGAEEDPRPSRRRARRVSRRSERARPRANRRVEAPSPRPAAKPASTPAAGRAEVRIVIVPYGTVWVDGKKRGASPLTLKLSPGAHRIRGVGPNFEEGKFVRVEAGDSKTFVLKSPNL